MSGGYTIYEHAVNLHLQMTTNEACRTKIGRARQILKEKPAKIGSLGPLLLLKLVWRTGFNCGQIFCYRPYNAQNATKAEQKVAKLMRNIIKQLCDELQLGCFSPIPTRAKSARGRLASCRKQPQKRWPINNNTHVCWQ